MRVYILSWGLSAKLTCAMFCFFFFFNNDIYIYIYIYIERERERERERELMEIEKFELNRLSILPSLCFPYVSSGGIL